MKTPLVLILVMLLSISGTVFGAGKANKQSKLLRDVGIEVLSESAASMFVYSLEKSGLPGGELIASIFFPGSGGGVDYERIATIVQQEVHTELLKQDMRSMGAAIAGVAIDQQEVVTDFEGGDKAARENQKSLEDAFRDHRRTLNEMLAAASNDDIVLQAFGVYMSAANLKINGFAYERQNVPAYEARGHENFLSTLKATHEQANSTMIKLRAEKLSCKKFGDNWSIVDKSTDAEPIVADIRKSGKRCQEFLGAYRNIYIENRMKEVTCAQTGRLGGEKWALKDAKTGGWLYTFSAGKYCAERNRYHASGKFKMKVTDAPDLESFARQTDAWVCTAQHLCNKEKSDRNQCSYMKKQPLLTYKSCNDLRRTNTASNNI